MAETSNDLSAATDKIKNFCTNKIDDANYYVEKKKKQFEISEAKGGLDRTKADTKNWIDRQTRELGGLRDKTREGLDKAAKDLGFAAESNENQNQNENETRRPGEADEPGCGTTENFRMDCAGCGLFST